MLQFVNNVWHLISVIQSQTQKLPNKMQHGLYAKYCFCALLTLAEVGLPFFYTSCMDQLPLSSPPPIYGGIYSQITKILCLNIPLPCQITLLFLKNCWLKAEAQTSLENYKQFIYSKWTRYRRRNSHKSWRYCRRVQWLFFKHWSRFGYWNRDIKLSLSRSCWQN